jgi:ectoine hydroxylase-related dioxygenase (phytanoyl-CoA dioxygenase family)
MNLGVVSVQFPLDSPLDDIGALASPCLNEISEALSRDGFLALNAITDADEVVDIRATLSGFFAKQVGAKEGSMFDTLASKPGEQSGRSIQLTNPTEYAPELLRTQFVRNATKIARQVLSSDAMLIFDFALLKPAYIGKGTPWHQDEAYREPGFTHDELTFWMPLQDVGRDDGCMVFIPGSHHGGLLEHRWVNDDPQAHALECCGIFPEAEAVDRPLPAGGCTIHTSRTIHCTKDNISSVDRYAYILAFGVPPKRAPEPQAMGWMEQRNNAHRKTKRAWLLRGGIFTLIKRKWQRGELRGTAMIRYTLAKGIRILLGR